MVSSVAIADVSGKAALLPGIKVKHVSHVDMPEGVEI